jgi:hypothetical protein
MNALKRVKKLIAIGLLANTLYITPIWAQGMQSPPSVGATQTTFATNVADQLFVVIDKDGNELKQDNDTGSYVNKYGEAYDGTTYIDVANEFKGFLSIDGEGDKATVTFTKAASDLSDSYTEERGEKVGADLDMKVYSAIAARLANTGYTGIVGFQNYDGTPLIEATLADDLVTMTNLKGQEISQFPILGAVETFQFPPGLGNWLFNQGNKPLEGGTTSIAPAQSEGQLSSVPQQSQVSGSTAGALSK